MIILRMSLSCDRNAVTISIKKTAEKAMMAVRNSLKAKFTKKN